MILLYNTCIAASNTYMKNVRHPSRNVEKLGAVCSAQHRSILYEIAMCIRLHRVYAVRWRNRRMHMCVCV